MICRFRLAALIALPLALAACQGGDKPAGDARAEGEILPGSASDAMLPLDSVRSQPPLAPRPTASGKTGTALDGEAMPAAGESSEPASAAPAAAESAAPTPTGE